MDEVVAMVTSLQQGRQGPYAVAKSDVVEGSITFSLSPPTWSEGEQPEPAHFVVLSGIRRMSAGWRASRARFYGPADAARELPGDSTHFGLARAEEPPGEMDSEERRAVAADTAAPSHLHSWVVERESSDTLRLDLLFVGPGPVSTWMGFQEAARLIADLENVLNSDTG